MMKKIQRFWWDSFSCLYLYAAVISFLLIPLWFTAGWREEDDLYGGVRLIGLHSADTAAYSITAVVLFFITAVLLLLPLFFHNDVHKARRLILPRLCVGAVLLFLILLTAAMAQTAAEDEQISGFSLQIGTVLLFLFLLASLTLQSILSVRSRRFRSVRPLRVRRPKEESPKEERTKEERRKEERPKKEDA